MEKGVCYSTSVLQPTIESEHIIDSSEGNNISVELKDLIEGRQYYVRAYAISRDGTFYSVAAEFSTVQHYLPTVEELAEVEVNDDNATMEARLTDNGGMSITECGFCWDSSSANLTSPGTRKQ